MGRLVWPGGGHSHCGVLVRLPLYLQPISSITSPVLMWGFCPFIFVIFYAVKVGEQGLLLAMGMVTYRTQLYCGLWGKVKLKNKLTRHWK